MVLQIFDTNFPALNRKLISFFLSHVRFFFSPHFQNMRATCVCGLIFGFFVSHFFYLVFILFHLKIWSKTGRGDAQSHFNERGNKFFWFLTKRNYVNSINISSVFAIQNKLRMFTQTFTGACVAKRERERQRGRNRKEPGTLLHIMRF